MLRTRWSTSALLCRLLPRRRRSGAMSTQRLRSQRSRHALCAERLENRRVLSGDVLASVLAPVEFETTNQSMWGPAGPSAVDTGTLFSGIEWDVEFSPIVGSEAANNFIALDAATSGKIGVDFRALLDPGSVDASFATQVSLEVVRGDGDQFTIHSELVGGPTGQLLTRSPNIDIQSNLIFELAAFLEVRGEIGTPDVTITVPTVTWVDRFIDTLFGRITVPTPVFGSTQVTIPGITLAAFEQTLLDFDIANTLELLKLTNDPAHPEFSILGFDLADAAPGENLAATFELAFDPLAPPTFFDVNVVDPDNPQKPKKDHNVNPFDVGVELSMGDITIEAATLFLEDNTFSAGALTASGAANLARIDIDADFLATILLGLPPLGASAGISVAGFDLASFSYDLLDVDIGPQFSVSQDFEFVPELWVTLSFDKPVIVNGQATTQHTMPVGSSLDVIFAGANAGETLDVQTSYFINNVFRNSTNLLVAPFVDALVLGASLDTFLGPIFDGALYDFDPIAGPATKLATIFEQTYSLGGFEALDGETLNLVFNQPPVINPQDLILSAATVDEGTPVTLAGSFTDVDAGQTHSVAIDWGDGTMPTTIELEAGVHQFGPFQHTYVDDSASPRTITVTVTDEFGTGDNAATAVSVVNVAPTLSLSGETSVDEGSQFTLNLASSDPGDDTIAHWTVNWGDGSPPQTVVANPPTVTHTYADGTTVHRISAAATDDDGTFDANFLDVTVNNVDPVVSFAGSSLNLDAQGNPISLSGVRGQTLDFGGSFSDPGLDNQPLSTETFSYQINWGDGTVTPWLPAAVDAIGLAGVATTGSFDGKHIYTSNGEYSITVRVQDDDGGTTELTQVVHIAVASMQVRGVLAVGGTQGNDFVGLVQLGQSGSVYGLLNSNLLGPFTPTEKLLVFGQDGNDILVVGPWFNLPAWLYGGAGNDVLSGGKRDDVLMGGDGNDLLLGGAGRDLLVGGDGADRIIGNSNDDLLIAGMLNFADPDAAATGIMAEWTSDHTYATRIANLSGRTEAQGNADFAQRLNDDYFLHLAVTVVDDDDQDILTGSVGDDWFWFDLDLDRATDLRDEAFAEDLSFLTSP